ncbi:MAG: hypothetical protein Q9209_007792 [Squamulea sp. 1 TL-2023]
MGAISDFVEAFSRDYYKYLSIEKEVKAVCEEALRDIQFCWQSRVKSPESLEKKLKDRNGDYKGESENVADVVDLVGGRVILADLRDTERVEAMIKNTFKFKGQVQHPKAGQTRVNPDSRYRGYGGHHFHVTRKDGANLDPCNPVIEIQVMTAFMWVYATVAHDIEYKELHGEPSQNLKDILEMLKAVANMGETALELFNRQVLSETPQQGNISNLPSTSTIKTVGTLVCQRCSHDARKTDLRLYKEKLGVNKDEQRSELQCKLRGLKASDACKWILADSKFHDWYNAPNSERLVIFGNMGCGKTIMTAHVIEELIYRKEHRSPRALICYHYCTDNQTGNILYIYSSLILQLLDQQESLKVEFEKWYEATRKSDLLDPARSSGDLGKFFSNCVEFLKEDLFIIIDALDECEDETQEELITLLDILLKKTPRLKIFFSSRPQAGIENLLHGSTEIRWVPTRERDAIIVEHIVKRRLGQVPFDVQSLVTERLSELAQGSAIWVKLTVELIQKRKIQAIRPMKRLLASIPPPAELSELYAKLFADQVGDDSDNEQLVLNALEVLAVARRPLSILELGWAVNLNDRCDDIRTVKALEDYVDEKRVLSLLQPFLSQLDFQDVRKSQVILVHHSLRELVLREVPSKWAQMQNIADKRRVEKQHPELEAAILRMCVKYLLLDEINQNDLLPAEGETYLWYLDLPGAEIYARSFDKDHQHITKQVYYDPSSRGFGEFFGYASCFWVDHFEVSAPDHLPDTSDIVALCRARSRRMRNWTRQYCRPECTIKPSPDVFNMDFLYLLGVITFFGLDVSVTTVLPNCDVDGEEFLDDPVDLTVRRILGYCPIAQFSILKILFRSPLIRTVVDTRGFYDINMMMWGTLKGLKPPDETRNSREWDDRFDFVLDIFYALIGEESDKELLCEAVGLGCLPIVERLFKEAAHNPAMKKELLRDPQRIKFNPAHVSHQSVGEAVTAAILRFFVTYCKKTTYRPIFGSRTKMEITSST